MLVPNDAVVVVFVFVVIVIDDLAFKYFHHIVVMTHGTMNKMLCD